MNNQVHNHFQNFVELDSYSIKRVMGFALPVSGTTSLFLRRLRKVVTAQGRLAALVLRS